MECPACGYSLKDGFRFIERHSVEFKTEFIDYNIYQCPECHSEFAEPMKSAPPDWYSYRGEYYGWRWEFGEFLKDLRSLLPISGKVLEIGCGEGIVLQRLKDLHDAFGIDFNRDAIDKVKTRGLKAYPMTIEEFSHQFPEIKFDAIAFFHVLEHMENPSAFLGNVSKVLNPNGLVFLSVPNPNRISLALQRERWDYPPHHLCRFSVDGLQKLLEEAGFSILKIKYESFFYYFHQLLKSTVKVDYFLKTLGINVSSFKRQFRNLVRFPFLVLFKTYENICFFFFLLKNIIIYRISFREFSGTIYIVAKKDNV